MNQLDILEYGDRAFVQTIKTVPFRLNDQRGVCGVWSVKDIIAHLASFEVLLIDVFSIYLGGGPTPTLDQWLTDSEVFNLDQVRRRKDKTATEVFNEYLDMRDIAMSTAAQIPVELWQQPGTLPWYGGSYSLDVFIVVHYCAHKRQHSAQIAAFLDQITRPTNPQGAGQKPMFSSDNLTQR